MIKLTTWETPASKYPRKKIGAARIATYYYTPGCYECYGLKDQMYYRTLRRIRITNLKINGETWMVDDPPHYWAMEEHANYFSGHVLCAGLGLGLMVHTMAKNPKITKITIVEKSPDVIRLIKPLIPDCEIIQGDFWDKLWVPKADGVFYDLFVGHGPDMALGFIQCYIELVRRYRDTKVIRIHGASNKYLEALHQDLYPVVCGIPDTLENAMKPMVASRGSDTPSQIGL